ncbi:MAG TPA: DUF5671 domain-containing protein [Actinomycetota bacterium]|nr:DUF5671 domain-containing protein [Actinomycetota bacterium]
MVALDQPAAEARRPPGRAAFALGQLYYYLAALTGVGFLVGGAIGALLGVRDLILPGEFGSSRETVGSVLHGAAFALIGAVCLWWHLREARRRDERPHADVFWGRSLYFHLVAALALGFVLTGVSLLLMGLVDLVFPECIVGDSVPRAAASASCVPDPDVPEVREASIRQILDAAIILVVSAPVWFWHLRRGRQLTTGE